MTDRDFEVDEQKVRAELARVLASSDFAGSERHRRFLSFIVEEVLEGRQDRLKAYTIATMAFGRADDFDPQEDSIVRIEAGRLRRALEHYYFTDGRNSELQIVVPKGSYVPLFLNLTGIGMPEDPPPETVRHQTLRKRGVRILVAPFEQEGGAEAVSGLAESFTRQLIFGLTRFSNVLVYGADTSERLGNAARSDVVMRDLGADFVLSGRVTIGDGRFAIEALLQDTRDQRFVWSERFERDLAPAEIYGLRDEVAQTVAQTLAQPYGVLFSRALDEDGAAAQTMDGYHAVVDFYQYLRSFDSERMETVREQLEKAVADDPAFAEGYACLSRLYTDRGRFPPRTAAEMKGNVEHALLLAGRALLLAPNSSNAHHALGLALWFAGDTEASLASYRKALSLNPADTDIMADLGIRYALLMDWERAVPLVEDSFRRNPCQPTVYRMALVLYHFSVGDYEQGLRQTRLIEAPALIYRHIGVAICAIRLGLIEEAHEAIGAIEEIAPGYGARIETDLEMRNCHPVLARDAIAALRDAGLGVDGHVQVTRQGTL